MRVDPSLPAGTAGCLHLVPAHHRGRKSQHDQAAGNKVPEVSSAVPWRGCSLHYAICELGGRRAEAIGEGVLDGKGRAPPATRGSILDDIARRNAEHSLSFQDDGCVCQDRVAVIYSSANTYLEAGPGGALTSLHQVPPYCTLPMRPSPKIGAPCSSCWLAMMVSGYDIDFESGHGGWMEEYARPSALASRPCRASSFSSTLMPHGHITFTGRLVGC